MEHIKWIDARSVDSWSELDDIDPVSAIIETWGCVFKETRDVVCVAGSRSKCRCDAKEQYTGIMVIPRQAILFRVDISNQLEAMRQTLMRVVRLDLRVGGNERPNWMIMVAEALGLSVDELISQSRAQGLNREGR